MSLDAPIRATLLRAEAVLLGVVGPEGADRAVQALIEAGFGIADLKFGESINHSAPPRRAFEFLLKAGGDTIEDALEMLIELSDNAIERGAATNCALGGYRRGGYVNVALRPGLSHEAFAAELRAWCMARQLEEKAPGAPG